MAHRDSDSILHLKNLLLVAVVAIAGGVYTVFNYRSDSAKRDLLIQSSTKFVEGKIKHLDGMVSNRDAMYTYIYQGKQYENFFRKYIPCRTKSFSQEARDSLMKLDFLVAVNPKKPNLSYPLIDPEDYKDSDQPFPEKLKGAYRKYISCEW